MAVRFEVNRLNGQGYLSSKGRRRLGLRTSYRTKRFPTADGTTRAANHVVDLMEALRRSVGQEAAQGVQRTEGNADADRGQEAQGGGSQEVDGQAAAEVRLIFR